eukprot:5439823-Ditylum_brightwellii.AAC.1
MTPFIASWSRIGSTLSVLQERSTSEGRGGLIAGGGSGIGFGCVFGCIPLCPGGNCRGDKVS